MEYLDKLIPLAGLGLIAAFLALLARRVAWEKDAAPRVEKMAAPVEAVPVAESKETLAIVVAAETPVPSALSPAVEPVAKVNVVVPIAAVVQTDEKPKRLRRKKPMPAVVKVILAPTPIQTVLGLLNEKDSLAVAFVLREIFSPPVSKRK